MAPALRGPTRFPCSLMSAFSAAAHLPSATANRRRFLNPSPSSHPPRRSLSFPRSSANSDDSSAPAPPAPEKRSFGVATGEFFLGIASLLIRNRRADYEASTTVRVGSVVDVDVDVDVRSPGRRGPVARESIDDGVIWEQRSKDVEAERDRKFVRSPGFSFSAAGLLLPYHLGVAQYLIEKRYITESTPLAGSSAGAIACAIIASGVSMEEALKATKFLADDCRLKGTAFRLGGVLKEVLQEFLPDDIHTRSTGRIRVAITQIQWRPRGLLVDQFESKEDLINALFTSSFIPGYLAPRPVTLYRNRLCIDGGLTLFMPPTSASETVRVCAFPVSRLKLDGIGISPDCNPVNRATPRQLFNWALEPAEDDLLDNLFELGYMDAEVWGNLNPVEEIVREEFLSDNAI